MGILLSTNAETRVTPMMTKNQDSNIVFSDAEEQVVGEFGHIRSSQSIRYFVKFRHHALVPQIRLRPRLRVLLGGSREVRSLGLLYQNRSSPLPLF